MNVWLIQTGEPLPIEAGARKIRTALLAEKLVKRGHGVVWWTSAFDHHKKEWIFREDREVAVEKGFDIIALKSIGYKKNISLTRFIDHRVMARKFRNSAPQKAKPDMVIASMPPHDLACEAVRFARRNNIPALVDIRDCWPDIFFNHIPAGFKGIARVLLKKDFQMAKKTLQSANGLIAVTETFFEWGLRYAGRERGRPDRVFYLGDRKRSENHQLSPSPCPLPAGERVVVPDLPRISDLAGRLKNRFVVTFVGTFASYHNPAVLVDCAAELREKNMVFVLAGNGEFFAQTEKRVAGLSNVILPGWLTQAEISLLLRLSQVGICPTSKMIDLFPNKAFAYLSAGLPVISAFQGDLKRLIESQEIGFYYPPNDTRTLVNHLTRLSEDAALYARLSQNARRVFSERLDADRIYEEYAGHIEMVAREYEMDR